MEETKSKFVKWVNPGYEYRLRIRRHIFNEKDIQGKFILDIGGGNGEDVGSFILEFGASGATVVDVWVGNGGISRYKKIIDLQKVLGRKLEVIKCDIFNFSSRKKYGFILAKSSLHHIIKSKKRLIRDPDLKQRVVELFKRIGSWLEGDGKFVIVEVARRNWSPIPKYRKRFKTVVDLSTKQDPRDWISALKKAGFKEVKVSYPSPVVFDKFKTIHWLFNNYLMCILTGSCYIIEASKFKNIEKNSR